MVNNHDANRSIDTLHEWLIYDPEEGTVVWRKSPSTRIKVGYPAGSIKSNRYLYFTKEGYEMPMCRVVWAMHYGEWPQGVMQYRDGDGTNMKIANLAMSMFPTTKIITEDGRVKYRMSKEAQTHYGVRRYYGMSVDEYREKLALQGNVCAICEGEEPTTRGSDKRELSVDHCHSSGKIRRILCSNCNQSLGQLEDDIEIMEAALAYLEKHSIAL